jgi:phenylalanyl-tRNA synthetase alpha chain
MAKYILTKEGESYSTKGTPETNLVRLLESSPEKSMPISKASSKAENFPIALKWALEEGWVSKKSGNIILKSVPKEKTKVEKSLEKFGKGEDLTESEMKVLVDRNLVNRITETYERTEEAIKKAGNVIGDLTHDIIRTGLWKGKKFKPIDITARKKIDKKRIVKGNRQPYNHFLMGVRKKLVEMGFKEMTGPIVEMEFWNFDALFQPQNHPARDWAQTYSMKYPKFGKLPAKSIVDKVKASHESVWKYKWSEKKASRLMPRAHDTAVSPRYLAKGVDIPGKYFSIARCYRPDVIDAIHGVEFNQMGGFVIAEDLTFKHILGLLKEFVRELAGVEKVRFYSDYYPFTEPSCQISIRHPELGWVEAAGAGIFRTELTEPLGVKEPVIAWGFGIDRLAMHALKINDIRNLFSRNLGWLRAQKAR